ncbi:MAG: PAS domain S-box protein, partial [Bacteroidota bacterium]|nr:PAS domain S-box protein [Bacteroidota bacterium]
MILGILMSRQHTNWQNEKAKDRFIESEQRFVRIMNNINMFFFNLDLNGNFVSFNRYLLKNTGYSEEELIGKSAVDIFVPDDEETRYQFYEIINKGGERLIATVNDLIDISQIETQQIKVNKTAFSVSELLSTLLYGSTFFF